MRRSNPAARVLSVCTLLFSVALLSGCDQTFHSEIDITIDPEIQKHGEDIHVCATARLKETFPLGTAEIKWGSAGIYAWFTFTLPGQQAFTDDGVFMGAQYQGVEENDLDDPDDDEDCYYTVFASPAYTLSCDSVGEHTVTVSCQSSGMVEYHAYDSDYEVMPLGNEASNTASFWIVNIDLDAEGVADDEEDDAPGLIIGCGGARKKLTLSGWPAGLPRGTLELSADDTDIVKLYDQATGGKELTQDDLRWTFGQATQGTHATQLLAEYYKGHVPAETVSLVNVLMSGKKVDPGTLLGWAKPGHEGRLPQLGWIISAWLQTHHGGAHANFEALDLRDLLDQIGVKGNPGQGLALGLLYRRLKKLAQQGEIPDLPILKNERSFKRFAVWAMNNPDAAMAQFGLTELLNGNGLMLQQANGDNPPLSTVYVQAIHPGEVNFKLKFDADGVTDEDNVIVSCTMSGLGIEEMDYTNDHGIMTDWDTDWTDGEGAPFRTPEWKKGQKASPVSYSMGVAIKARVGFKAMVEPYGTACDLVGTGSDASTSFHKGTATSAAIVYASVTANGPLPSTGAREPRIKWTLHPLFSNNCALGSTKNETFITFGTPTGSVPTYRRLNWACKNAQDCQTATEVADSICYAIPAKFAPKNDIGWPLLEDGSRACCIAWAKLMKSVLDILGVPGANTKFVFASSNAGAGSCLDLETRWINARPAWLVMKLPDSNLQPWNAFEGCCEVAGIYYSPIQETRQTDDYAMLKYLVDEKNMEQWWVHTVGDVTPGETGWSVEQRLDKVELP